MAVKDIVKGICNITRCKYDVYTKERTDEIVNSLKMRYTLILDLNLNADDSYQLTLPDKTIFIEPLIKGSGSDYSGGSFVVPGGGYSYIFSADYGGLWIRCDDKGLVSISEFEHSGASVTGFRIWYFG